MDVFYFVPGRCYRSGDQMMRVIGPVFPTALPLADRTLWREATEQEWDEALARARSAAASGVYRGQPPATQR